MSRPDSASRVPLRLWPGVTAAVLLWLIRFVPKTVVPGRFLMFEIGLLGGVVGTLAILVWWAFFSRAARGERLAGVVLIPVALYGAWETVHQSMNPVWLIAYAIPFTAIAFVAWAVATRRLGDDVRRVTMVATIVAACGVWTLFRMGGISGDHAVDFRWRWIVSAEERLVADATSEPVSPSVPAAATVAWESVAGDTIAIPTEAPPVPDSLERPVARTARVEWEGFRGPGRDSVIRGRRIDTNWTQTPPKALWRRPVGPGWSSFSVSGDTFYTQEQRGDQEVVASYRIATGQPVWTHRDDTRFFESNGGAGPRGTPTLHQGRVYAFGATGILNVLDAVSGAVVWSRNVSSETKISIPVWGFSSSPLIVNDTVIVAAAGQLVAYDAASGKERWRGPAGGGSYSSPQLATIDGVAQILLMSDDRGVTSVGPADGAVLWEHAWTGTSIVQPAMTRDGDVLISRIDTGTRRLAIEHGQGGWAATERWTSNRLKPYFNDFVVHEGYAYGFDGNIMTCIDLADGARKWKGGRYGNGQLVLLADQDVLLVVSEEGELALVSASPDSFTEIARFSALDGKTWNHPVLAGDILLVRNGEEMAAFRLTLK